MSVKSGRGGGQEPKRRSESHRSQTWHVGLERRRGRSGHSWRAQGGLSSATSLSIDGPTRQQRPLESPSPAPPPILHRSSTSTSSPARTPTTRLIASPCPPCTAGSSSHASRAEPSALHPSPSQLSHHPPPPPTPPPPLQQHQQPPPASATSTWPPSRPTPAWTSPTCRPRSATTRGCWASSPPPQRQPRGAQRLPGASGGRPVERGRGEGPAGLQRGGLSAPAVAAVLVRVGAGAVGQRASGGVQIQSPSASR